MELILLGAIAVLGVYASHLKETERFSTKKLNGGRK